MGNTLDGYILTARENTTLGNSRIIYDTIVMAYDPAQLSDAQKQMLSTYPNELARGTINHGTTREQFKEFMQTAFPNSREHVGVPGYLAGLFSNELNGTRLVPTLEAYLSKHS